MTNLTSHRAIASLAAAVAAAIVPFSTILITPAFAASVPAVSHPYGASSNEAGPTQPTTVQLPRSASRTASAAVSHPYGASSNEAGPTQPTTVQLPRSASPTTPTVSHFQLFRSPSNATPSAVSHPYGASSNEAGPTQPTTVQLPRSVSLPPASVIPGHVDIWLPPERLL
jgi:hypothetical protein